MKNNGIRFVSAILMTSAIGTGITHTQTGNGEPQQNRRGIVGIYFAIENGVVTGYKAVERFFVSGYKAIENFFVSRYKIIENAALTRLNAVNNTLTMSFPSSEDELIKEQEITE